MAPARVTAEWLRDWAEGTVDDALVQLVVGWDLTTDDGEEYPLTVEGLKELPTLFKDSLHREIMQQVFPNLNAARG